jgi:hypothetical protein
MVFFFWSVGKIGREGTLTCGAQVGAAVPVDDQVLDPLRVPDACGDDFPFIVLGAGGSAVLCVSRELGGTKGGAVR